MDGVWELILEEEMVQTLKADTKSGDTSTIL
jgi:hypothetical protein